MDLTRLKALRSDMEKCFRCSLCKMAPLPVVRHPSFTDCCPAARLYHFHGFSGSGKQIMALSLLDGRIQADEALAKIAFACTACGYCDVACKFIMDAERQQVNAALREYLTDAGLAPPALQKMAADLERIGRPESGVPRSGVSWSNELPVKHLPHEKADTLILAGCVSYGDMMAARTARRLARILIHAGIEVGVLSEGEPCCGLPAYWAGNRGIFSRMASKNAAMLEGLGARTVVMASGSCLGAVRGKYPEYARAPGVDVIHATEMLARLIEKGRLRMRKPVNMTVTYHDPCYLGRQSEPYVQWEGEEKIALGVMTYTDPPRQVNRGTCGVYDAPRAVLKAIPGLKLIEMYRIREYSFCCGAGGGAPAAFPELARSAAIHRLSEACAVKAEVMVTACAYCAAHFRKTQAGLEASANSEAGLDRKLPVADVIDLVFEAAGLED
ncbi:MAG TPA: (Fe-S)-binding protein [bacterium]|nr:(Fe-S)-binding protein [bacterium]